MWKYEWKKLLGNKAILSMIIGCFLLNGFLVFRQGTQYDEEKRSSPDNIHRIYEEMDSIENKQEWLQKEIEKEENAEDMGNYARRSALIYVLESVEEVENYDGYLENIKIQAKRISRSALFSDTDSFSKRNARQIPKKYDKFEGMTLEVADSQGALLATQSEMTDVLFVVLAVLLTYFFISMEREEGTLAFVRCTKNGGRELGVRKIAIILAGSLVGMLLLYVQNFIIMANLYGFGNLGRPVQSVNGFIGSAWKINLGQYFLLFLCGKLFVACVFVGVITWICLKGKNILRTSVVLVLLVGVEWVFYAKIPSNSWLGILKWCNLFSFIRTENFFQTYETVNLFSYPVSSVIVCSIAGGILFIICIVQSILCYEKVSWGEYAQKKEKKKREGRQTKGHGIFFYEFRKVMWINGAGVVLLLFTIGYFMTVSGEKIYFSQDELYYKHYLKELEGEMTAEKTEFIQKEDERIKKLEESEESFDKERMLQCKPAFDQVKMQAERIGEKGVFLNEIGFNYLFDKTTFIGRTGLLLLIIMLAFFQTFVMEQIAGMDTVWNTIPEGRKKIQRRKWVILIVSVLLLSIFIEGMFIVHGVKGQQLSGLSEQIKYISAFEGFGNMPIAVYLFLRWGFECLAGIGGLIVIAGVSKKVKNTATVLLVSGGIAGLFYLCMRFIII